MGWDEEQIAKLKALLADKQKFTYSEIGQRLGGKSRNAISGMVSRLGLNGRAPKPDSRGPRTSRGPRAPRKSAPRYKLASIPKQAASDLPNGGETNSLEGLVGVPYSEAPYTVCRYPLWPDTQTTGNVCGLPGSPWCDGHKRIVYRPRGATA